MAAQILSGEISDSEAAIALLREIETKRITGTLTFEAEGVSGALELFSGELAAEQPEREDGRDSVDIFLELSGGTYEVEARLPPLAMSRGDDLRKSGSLTVHVPADLLNYCEHAGLTGSLTLTHEERQAKAIYANGELLGIELDGQDTEDLHEIFAWERGRFAIQFDADDEARADLEVEVEEPISAEWSRVPKRKREDTRQFLRVVEMALSDVIGESEKARSPTRTSPPLPPPPERRTRPAALTKLNRRERESTVRLVYLTGEAPETSAIDESTRHVRDDVDSELALTDARPERRAQEKSPMAKKKKKTKKKPAPKREAAPAEKSASAPTAESPDGGASVAEPPWRGPLITAGWVLGVLALGLLVLAFLARLPPT